MKETFLMDDRMQFSNRAEFRAWLARNHSLNGGIWMVFGKVRKLETIKRREALEEAICFGWIDGQIRSVDELRYLVRYTPRRKRSRWSETNRGLAAKLTKQGQMAEPGLAAIARAKKEGTWNPPDDGPAGEDQVAMLVQALAGHEPALSNFQNMSPSVRRTYAANYLSAKGEDTRKRRLERIIGRLNENKKPM
jgi:uncharacterized protein YdeI (YjbR/CyaY-like superfamily)